MGLARSWASLGRVARPGRWAGDPHPILRVSTDGGSASHLDTRSLRKRRPRAARGKARLTLHFPIWGKKNVTGEEGEERRTVNMISRGGGGGGPRPTRARRPRGFPVSQRTLADALLAPAPPRARRSPVHPNLQSITSPQVLTVRVCDSSTPDLLSLNQHIYSHLGRKNPN